MSNELTLSILTSSIFIPASNPIYLIALSIDALSASVLACAGSGTVPVIETTSCGEVPHETVGEISAEEILTDRSK